MFLDASVGDIELLHLGWGDEEVRKLGKLK